MQLISLLAGQSGLDWSLESWYLSVESSFTSVDLSHIVQMTRVKSSLFFTPTRVIGSSLSNIDI